MANAPKKPKAPKKSKPKKSKPKKSKAKQPKTFQDWLLEPMADVAAEVNQRRNEAIQMLEGLQSGALKPRNGLSVEAAIKMLTANIVGYESVLRHYSRGETAPRSWHGAFVKSSLNSRRTYR